jgi:hypothetical protein
MELSSIFKHDHFQKEFLKESHMRLLHQNTALLLLLIASQGCNNTAQNSKASFSDTANAKGTYAYDVNYLKKHTAKVIELTAADGAGKVLLSADYQGRVMTSTATGDTGLSFGWFNYHLISSHEKKKQFNPVGGEERFWLGPEGGQYSLYFKQKDTFNINHWQVPAFIDSVSYDVVRSSNSEAVFSSKASLTNYSGTTFNIQIDRTISLLDKPRIENELKATLPADLHFVGYQTINRLQNIGEADWTKEKGLLSIWLLGMFTPTPKTMVIIPFSPADNATSLITSNYFGSIPADRLQVKDSVLYFVCDGKYRSKIGLSPIIAKPMAASFDFQNNVLTILIPEIHKDASYVNSKWEMQKEPYKGDVINSYNDGPLDDGSQLGPFYEIESSSPALALKKGEAASYKQTTLHLQGNYNSLKQLAKSLLGVDLDEIKR